LSLTIIANIMGIFAFNENGDIKNIFSKRLFQTPDQIAEKLYLIQKNKIISELRELLDELKDQGIKDIVLEDNELAQKIKEEYDFSVQVQKPSAIGKKVRANLYEIGKNLNLFTSTDQFKINIQNINLQLTKYKVKTASERKDKLIVQAIESVDDIDKSLNVFSSRIREWYSLHFPELNKTIEKHTTFLKLASEVGFRSRYNDDELVKKLSFNREKAIRISNLAKKSMGSQIQGVDLIPLQKFAAYTMSLYQLRDELSRYIDEAMLEVAPNLRGMVGAMLGARLISAAGGIMELAQKPSSTVQVLGAERALFRSLKTGAKPPKHGIIFQWDPVHNAKWWLRGKIARATASKLSIAARVDAFSGEYIADELLENLNVTIKELNKKYAEPPKKKKEKKTHKPKKWKKQGRTWKKKRDRKKKKGDKKGQSEKKKKKEGKK